MMLRRDADARIGDGEGDLSTVVQQSARNTDLPTLGKFERVGNEVPEDLRNFGFVGEERREVRRVVEHQIYGRPCDQRTKHATERAEQILYRKLDRVYSCLAGFHFRQVQQVIDQLGESFSRSPQIGYLLFLFRRQIAIHAIEQ